MLPGPFHRQVGEACNPHTVRESTSMGALTSSGARNAREIVILTLRTLQFSRFAMLSVLALIIERMRISLKNSNSFA